MPISDGSEAGESSGTGVKSLPLEDLPAESDRVLAAAKAAGIKVRLAGGLAIRRLCPAAARAPLSRTYADLDLAVIGGSGRRAFTSFMVAIGYVPDDVFNAVNGQSRLYFHDVRNSRHVDVFVDAIRMCHVVNFRNRFELLEETLSPTDLLLSKLQVVELNHKDLLDATALLHDLQLAAGDPTAIDTAYLERVWGDDWPLWKTCGLTLGRIRATVPDLLGGDLASRVLASVDQLLRISDSAPKSLRWKVRARIGERIRWYEVPEEAL